MELKKWLPSEDLKILRRLSKLMSEASALSEVASRQIVSGIDGIDDNAAEVNHHRLKRKIADVYAELDDTVAALGFDRVDIRSRRAMRRQQNQSEDKGITPQMSNGAIGTNINALSS